MDQSGSIMVFWVVLVTFYVGKSTQGGSGVATPYYWVAMVVPIRMS